MSDPEVFDRDGGSRSEPLRLALVAHDNRKSDLIEWTRYNAHVLLKHKLICTGTTGRLVIEALKKMQSAERVEPAVTLLKSGPLGGDQQLGALISDGEIDLVIFFWDPLQPQPHDVDVKALLRIAVVYNVPIACNRATADFLISSPLIQKNYVPIKPDFTDHVKRFDTDTDRATEK